MAPLGDTVVVMSVLLAALGLFLYSDQPILTAAAIDIVREGTAATTLGLLSTSRFVLSAASPLIASWLYSMEADYLFYYTAALYGAAVVLLAFIPLPSPRPSHDGHHGEDDHHRHESHHGHGSHDSHHGHGGRH